MKEREKAESDQKNPLRKRGAGKVYQIEVSKAKR